jgi:heat shock protein HslJ
MAPLMRCLPLAVAIGIVAGCQGDETISAYGAADKTWQLTELGNAPFNPQATLSFPAPGQISGQGPCNSFTASQDVPYPWFRAGPIASTRMACPDMAAETAFFTALSEATLSEDLGNTLILSNDDGVLLVFRSDG